MDDFSEIYKNDIFPIVCYSFGMNWAGFNISDYNFDNGEWIQLHWFNIELNHLYSIQLLNES